MISNYNLSFKGKRSYNQDYTSFVRFNNDACILILADGMGGYEGGEIASKTVVDASIEKCQDLIDHSSLSLKEIISQGFKSAFDALQSVGDSLHDVNEMGTTLVCVLIKDGKYVVGSIGDSRCYCIKKDECIQVTIDHTWVQDFINDHGQKPAGNISKQYGHILTKSISYRQPYDEPDIFPVNSSYFYLDNDEILLICSDGLITDKTDTDVNHISDVVLSHKSLKRAAEHLVSKAYMDGSTDNISVALVESGKVKRKTIRKNVRYVYPPVEVVKNESVETSKRWLKNKWITASIIAFVGIILIGALWYFYDLSNKDIVFKDETAKEESTMPLSTDSECNTPNAPDIAKGKIEDKKFDGFENTDRTLNLTKDTATTISWYEYENAAYKIVNSKDTTQYIENIKDYNIKLKDLSSIVTSPGSYFLQVFAVSNDTIIKGKKELNLNIQ